MHGCTARCNGIVIVRRCNRRDRKFNLAPEVCEHQTFDLVLDAFVGHVLLPAAIGVEVNDDTLFHLARRIDGVASHHLVAAAEVFVSIRLLWMPRRRAVNH